MKKFRTYEEIEEVIEKEGMETFKTFVFNDLVNSIKSKANDLLNDSFWEYIIVMHPHRFNSSVVIADSKLNFKDNDFDFDLEAINDYFNSLDIGDVWKNIYCLDDLNSYEIYWIKDLKDDFKTKEEAINYIYDNQGYHNRVSKEKIKNELDWLWKQSLKYEGKNEYKKNAR